MGFVAALATVLVGRSPSGSKAYVAMSELSELIQRYKPPGVSNREIARRSKDRLSRATVDKYLRADHGKPTEEIIVAFHDVLGIPVDELRRAAGLPRGERGPYEPPSEAAQLDQRTRNALSELIRSITTALSAEQDRVDNPTVEDLEARIARLTDDQFMTLWEMLRERATRLLEVERAWTRAVAPEHAEANDLAEVATLRASQHRSRDLAEKELSDGELKSAARKFLGTSKGEFFRDAMDAAGEESQVDPGEGE